MSGYSLIVCSCEVPYLGARKTGTPCCCEVCGFIMPDAMRALREEIVLDMVRDGWVNPDAYRANVAILLENERERIYATLAEQGYVPVSMVEEKQILLDGWIAERKRLQHIFTELREQIHELERERDARS